MSSEWFYRIYGVLVKSEYFLPEGFSAEKGKFDVEIIRGRVSESLRKQIGPNGIVHLTKKICLAEVKDLVYFLIQDGKRIVVNEIGGEGERKETLIRLYLLGPIFNFLLSQRSALLLHASCIGYNNQCFVFAGQSGAGKSTLSAAFVRNSHYCLLSDDISLIYFSTNDEPFVKPAFARIKLLPDALEKLNISADGLEKLTAEGDKRNLLAHSDFEQNPMELKAIFVLKEADVRNVEVVLLKGKEKVANILDNLYWIHDRFNIAKKDIDFIQSAKVAKKCATYLITYNKQRHHPDVIVSHLNTIL